MAFLVFDLVILDTFIIYGLIMALKLTYLIQILEFKAAPIKIDVIKLEDKK